MARCSRLYRQSDQGALLTNRLDEKFANIDVQEMYPAGAPPKAENWTMDTFLKAAEACNKGGFPFGIGSWSNRRFVDTAGVIFQSFGAELVDAKGNLAVKTDAVRQALEYYKRLIAFLPPEVAAWDDASNNKWLISGKGALIMNPPSAWAVAKRDAPAVAEQRRVDGFPVGSEGPLCTLCSVFLGCLEFLQEQGGGKEPTYASVATGFGRETGGSERRLRLALPGRMVYYPEDMGRGKDRQRVRSTHYPEELYNHQILSIAASPAPPKIAQQIYAGATLTKMCLRYYQGEAMEKTLAWAEGERQGFMRS